MTKWMKTHLPCPKCMSSDAFSIDINGNGYCFSCNTFVRSEELGDYSEMSDDTYRKKSSRREPDGSLNVGIVDEWRGISQKTLEKFNVLFRFDENDEPVEVAFRYPNGAVKIRSLREKRFWSKGNMSEATLFGKDLFPAGCAQAITITEGEVDALSVYEMMGDWPVVSVRSASSAKTDCAREHEYLNSFDKIYICFDNDEPGRKAAQEVASLFDFNKVYYVKIDGKFKDANDFLVNDEVKKFRRLWYNARRYLPDNIVSSLSDFKEILNSAISKPRLPYPWPDLQEKTFGMGEGEIVLLTALEGIGKTEIVRALEYHVLKTTDDNIGIIHLEETPERTLKGLAGLELGMPCHFPNSPVSNEDIINALAELQRREERIHIYSHFGSEDSHTILNNIRFLVAACGCKYIFFDHITMVVTGQEGNDERKELDYLSTHLAMLVRELGFTLVLVSHENDQGQTRGSRNISKIADLHVRLLRDITAENEIERNTTQLMVVKNRFGAMTGPSDKLFFDRETFSLRPLVEETDEEGLPKIQ